jgi:hypothetical protein
MMRMVTEGRRKGIVGCGVNGDRRAGAVMNSLVRDFFPDGSNTHEQDIRH